MKKITSILIIFFCLVVAVCLIKLAFFGEVYRVYITNENEKGLFGSNKQAIPVEIVK